MTVSRSESIQGLEVQPCIIALPMVKLKLLENEIQKPNSNLSVKDGWKEEFALHVALSQPSSYKRAAR